MNWLDFIPWVAAIAAVGGYWLLLWWLRRDTLKRGALEANNKTEAQALDDIRKANDARNRMESDPAYAERLSDKYRRD